MKRGISPLIGVVLLIGLVVALAAITITWSSDVLRKTTEGASKEKDVQLEFAKEIGIEVNFAKNVRVFHEVPEDSDYVNVEIENLKEREIENFIMPLYAYDTVYSNTDVGEGLDPFDIKRFDVHFPGYEYIDFYADKVVVVPVVRDQFGELQAAEVQARTRKFMCSGHSRYQRGNFNNEEDCDGYDINGLQEAWTSPETYERKFPCREKDLNCDGAFNQLDIAFFIGILALIPCAGAYADVCVAEEIDFSTGCLKSCEFVDRFQCEDGSDNDGDGLRDYILDCVSHPETDCDPGCTSPEDFTELTPDFQCDDGKDNGGDGFCDYNGCWKNDVVYHEYWYGGDSDCNSLTDNSEDS